MLGTAGVYYMKRGAALFPMSNPKSSNNRENGTERIDQKNEREDCNKKCNEKIQKKGKLREQPGRRCLVK